MVDFKSIDDKTTLAGTNRLEILMFRLSGGDETTKPEIYGINVFKVRELVAIPKLINLPNEPECIAGVANIRGNAIPVIDLYKYLGRKQDSDGGVLIITEFNGSQQAFLVHEIDNIIQLDWGDISEPPETLTQLSNDKGGVLTAVSVLEDGEILLIIDVEKIIADVLGKAKSLIDSTEMSDRHVGKTIIFADDSRVARAQVSLMLDKMGIKHQSYTNGEEILTALRQLADEADAEGRKLSDSVNAIITDIEMPVMDGYVLTRKLKEDKRFDGIPIMMHSSLSATENERLGMSVGVDAYLPKLQPAQFAKTLDRLMTEAQQAA